MTKVQAQLIIEYIELLVNERLDLESAVKRAHTGEVRPSLKVYITLMNTFEKDMSDFSSFTLPAEEVGSASTTN
jgi:hypothetical protein